MPRVHGGAVGRRLMLIGRMPQHVLELSPVIQYPEINFTDSITHTIPSIAFPMCVTGIRRLGHQHANKSGRHRHRVKRKSNAATLGISHDPIFEPSPLADAWPIVGW